MYITKSTRKETRDGAKLADTKSRLNIINNDYNTFIYINPSVKFYKCINSENFNQFIETYLPITEHLHPLKDTASDGKYYVFIRNGEVYLTLKEGFNEYKSREFQEEDGATYINKYYTKGEITQIDMLLDE